MRLAFAHVAGLALDGDERAPGGAITMALCGSLHHDGPCPLAPHHTTALRRSGDVVDVRTLFACTAEDEAQVRSLIRSALESGSFVSPGGSTTGWSIVFEMPALIADSESDHAAQLCAY